MSGKIGGHSLSGKDSTFWFTVQVPNDRRSVRLSTKRKPSEAAFTLTEIMITAGVLLVVGATALSALTMMNRYASSSRVMAAGQSVVQNQIDQILNIGPYVPTNTPPDIPTILTTGTTVTNNLPVLLDPDTGNPVVNGTLTTTIADSGTQVTGTGLYVLTASVVLKYTFRGKPFTIAMDTMRAPDQ